MCVNELTIIGPDNGLSPGRRQAIIWTSAGILLIGSLETNFSEISIEIHTFSFKKMRLKMLSAKWSSFGLGLNVLKAFLCTECIWLTVAKSSDNMDLGAIGLGNGLLPVLCQAIA